MDVNIPDSSAYHRILHYALVENLVYWSTGALVWIPWYFSETLGMVGMLVFTPVIIFLGTLHSLNKVPQIKWRKEVWVIIPTFVVTCVIIDLIFWVIWRGHNILEWYLPITRVGIGNFIGYLEMIVVGYISMELAFRSPRVRSIKKGLSFSLKFIIVSGVILFLFSLISAILFW